MVQVDLSIIVPLLNEAKYIEQSLINLDNVAGNKKCNYQIVVVDDGSKDSTLSNEACYTNKNSPVTVFGAELLAIANIYKLKMPVQLRLNKAPKLKEILKMFTDLLDIAIRVKMIWLTKYENSNF